MPALITLPRDRPGLSHWIEGLARLVGRKPLAAVRAGCPLRPDLLRDAGIAVADVEYDLTVSCGDVGDHAVVIGPDGPRIRASRSLRLSTTLPV